MKKDNNNRRKAAIGAVLAAGVTAGAVSATQTGNEVTNAESQVPAVEMTAADKVVIDGQEVQLEDMLPQEPVKNRAVPMYGVRQRPIVLMYGPKPRPGRPALRPSTDSVQESVLIERQVLEVVASTLNIRPRNVTISSKLVEDFKVDAETSSKLKTALEEKFDVVIHDDTFKMMKTVGDLVNCICVLKY